jgi:mannose-6-phosphate isomerase-like protein (cupin superfamily)
MAIIEKPWGKTQLVFENDTIHIYLAWIKAGGFCSKHFHKNKHNLFFVQSGSIIVKTWNEHSINEHKLFSGDKLLVHNNVSHQFLATEESILLEIYYSTIDHEDIIRHI